MSNVPIIPWSKRHKRATKAAEGGLPHNLSNSFAEPFSNKELLDWTIQRGDENLVKEYKNHSLVYTPNGGSSDVRAAIATLLYGDAISPEHILVCPGAQVALQIVMRTILQDNGHAITFSPGYQSLVEGPLLAGGQVTTLPLRPDRDWQMDIQEIEAAMRENTRLIVVNAPHNPAGTLMSRDTQTELRTLAAKHGLYILCDEVYRLLEHNPEDRIPAMADCYERGLSVVTLSKPWGACGVSIGWIATQDLTVRERLSDVQYFGTACPSRASELQALMVLRSSDFILNRNLEIIRQNKALLEDFMARYEDLFSWVPPRAGAIAAIKFQGPKTSAELGAELAQEGISIKPAYCFAGDAVTEETDYFRVGFGESKMPLALDALIRFVEMHKEALLCFHLGRKKGVVNLINGIFGFWSILSVI